VGEEQPLFDALLGVGRACMRMSEVERAKTICRAAAELARRLGDGERFAAAVLTAGYEHVPWIRDHTLIALLEEALAMLPAGDGALRARCMAQLAADRHPQPNPRPQLQLARDALAMARRVGDPEALLFTSSAASYAMGVYADPAERLDIHRETLRLALAAGERRVALRAHGFVAGTHWEMGDPAAAEPHVSAAEALVHELRHGRYQWLTVILRAAESLFGGRFEAALRGFREGEAVLAGDEARGAILIAAPVCIACVTERYDDVAVLEAQTRSAFARLRDPLAGCFVEMLLAQLHGRAGDRRRAEAQLAIVAAHPLFAAIEQPSWLSMLADACHLVGDRALADRIYRALLPRAPWLPWFGPVNACIDLPYARHLGLLAETLGRRDDAVAHLEDACARTARAAMRAHLARLWYELARALLARAASGDRDRAVELVAKVGELATELGQMGLLSQLSSLGLAKAPVAGRAEPRLALRRDGDFWSVTWGDRTAHLRDSRGLSLLAQLVENAGQELHVLQLVSPGAEPGDAGDAGPALDEEAVHSYRRRLLDLREELHEAEQRSDPVGAEKARAELEFLERELARGVGLGGRERRVGQAAERARTAVTKRLREAIRRIEAELPELGSHLSQSIRTGAFCGYLPDRRPG
jgi:hypothetical protein